LTTPDEVAPVRRAKRAPRLERVVVRSFPKIVFLYPTMLAAIIAGVGTWQAWGTPSRWGDAFLIVLAVNLIVLGFDFPRTTSLTLLFLVAAVILAAVVLNQHYGVFPWLEHHTRRLSPTANDQFYWIIAAVLAAILVFVWIIHRWFDYWEVLSNELIHHHGILGSIERLPAPGITLDKEIIDVFEFFLLGAGRLIIVPTGQGRPIVLENVPRINRAERNIKTVLGVTEVEISPSG
jgi:hypothetical protein